MTINNREQFLNTIASNLGRPVRTKAVRPKWNFLPQHEVLKDATKDELVEVLKKQCENIHTVCLTATVANLPDTLQQVVTDFGGESVITWKDERFEQLGLKSLMRQWPTQNIDLYEWDASSPEENIRQAEKANIGITISDNLHKFHL